MLHRTVLYMLGTNSFICVVQKFVKIISILRQKSTREGSIQRESEKFTDSPQNLQVLPQHSETVTELVV